MGTDHETAESTDALSELALRNSSVASPDITQSTEQRVTPTDAIDSGVRSIETNVDGGTVITYRGTIVPENPTERQITEDRFLDVLADLMARQLPDVPGAGEGREAQTVLMRNLLDRFLRALVPAGTRLEPVLRAALGLPEDLDSYVYPDQFLNGMLDLAPAARELRLNMQLGDNLERLSYASSDEEREAAAQALFTAAGIIWFPRFPRKGESKVNPKEYSFWRFTQLVGNEVHTLIQAHYWFEHPNDVLMFEDVIVAGPELLATIWHGDDFTESYQWLHDLRKALLAGTATHPSYKRPDILNITKSHLYEIKPLNEYKSRPNAVFEQLSDYETRLRPLMPNLRLPGFEEGDWHPFPVYYAGGTTMAVTEIVAPGLIVYERVGTPLPVLDTLRMWAQERKELGRGQAALVPSSVPAAVGSSHNGLLILAFAVGLLASAALTAGTGGAGGPVAAIGLEELLGLAGTAGLRLAVQ